jgi:hypothetical protein
LLDANELKLEVLETAAQAVRERGDSYGPPAEHFARTVGAINAILGHKLNEPLTPADWGVMMICDKLARHQHRPKVDNLVDVAGYAGCMNACGAG